MNITTTVSTTTMPRPLASALDNVASFKRNLIDTTIDLGKFTIFNRAVDAAGLTDTLKGQGPFTIFAPTDEAFAKLPKGRLEELLRPDHKSELRTLLNCHVIKGKLTSPELLMASPVKTSQGLSAVFRAKGTDVMINDAVTIIIKDTEASNGVIHGVDSVLLLKAA